MQFSAFRLLVYAIFTMVILYILHTILITATPETQLYQKISAILGRAHMDPGQAVTVTMDFPEGFTIAGETLSTPTRAVIFNCNDPGFCCEKKAGPDECDMPILWDDNPPYVKFQHKVSGLKVSARCAAGTVRPCTVFLGLVPAQFVVKNAKIDSTVELSRKQSALFSFDVQNIGETHIVAASITAKLYKIITEEPTPEERKIKELQLSDFSLGAGEKLHIYDEITLKDAGTYKLLVHIEQKDDPTNFSEVELKFKATGTAVQTCKPTRRIQPTFVIHSACNDLGSSECCLQKFECSGCTSGIECMRVWEKKEPSLKGELTILGTELVGWFFLPVAGDCSLGGAQ
jgi:hypothetical protein